MSRYLALLLLSGLIAGPAQAQTVVQLPSMHTFTVRTSVLVPDSGGAYLGGVGRAAQGRNTRGWGPLGRNAGRAGAVMGSGVMVHATVIDHAELDAMVLEEARALREAKGLELPRDGRRVTRPGDAPAESVAEIKRELAAEDAEQEAQAQRDFDKALAYEKAGEYSLARSYYRVAARKSTGPVKQRANERLAGLSEKSSTKNR